MAAAGPVTVMGAGSIGCWVGGCLQAAGATADFGGRPRVLAALRERGLRLTDLGGRDITLPPSALRLHEKPPAGSALVLLCVKSSATADAARTLPPGSLVLSLQNGVTNATPPPQRRRHRRGRRPPDRSRRPFCGEVVRLAKAHGLDAPLNAKIQRLVEADPRPRSGAALRTELGR